jgi:hypothetical protein
MLMGFTPVVGFDSFPAWGRKSIRRMFTSYVASSQPTKPAEKSRWSDGSAGTAGIKATGVNPISI